MKTFKKHFYVINRDIQCMYINLIFSHLEQNLVHMAHRRRMEREAKAKVVEYVWGKICFTSFRASCFASVYLEETVEFNRFFPTVNSRSTESKKLARQEIEQFLPPK